MASKRTTDLKRYQSRLKIWIDKLRFNQFTIKCSDSPETLSFGFSIFSVTIFPKSIAAGSIFLLILMTTLFRIKSVPTANFFGSESFRGVWSMVLLKSWAARWRSSHGVEELTGKKSDVDFGFFQSQEESAFLRRRLCLDHHQALDDRLLFLSLLNCRLVVHHR